MTDREAFLRRFHAARPGITSAALSRGRVVGGGAALGEAVANSYERLAAAVPPGARVLDLGCGDRYLLDRLGPRAVGVDLAPSPGTPGAPGTHGAPGALVAGRAQALPFADRSFDACVCHLALMLFDDVAQVVAELRRVVVPGGLFAAVLGGGPVEPPSVAGDRARDAFHRFLAIATLGGALVGGALGDVRAATEAGWGALFGATPVFERFELDLSGPFDDVWRFLGASYQLAGDRALRVREQLAAEYAGRAGRAGQAVVPCRVAMWLATVRL